MKVVYKYESDGKEYTADLLYYEKDGILYENKDGERIDTDHYIVEHNGEDITLFTEDIIKVIF